MQSQPCKMVKNGEWPGKKPTESDVIDMVVSRSMWYSHYKKLSLKISQYPDMLEWLKGGDEAPSDYEIWGEDKGTFMFRDLVSWLEEKETRMKWKGKGKGKAKEVKKDDSMEDKGKKSKKKKRN